MYKNYLPDVLPDKWVLSELDEENCYVEFLGFNGEYLISVMTHPEENPSLPYFLSLSQLKGILGRYDFEGLDWPEWHISAKEGTESALLLMEWINRHYESFSPLTLEVYVSLGTGDQLDLLSRFFGDELAVHEFEGQAFVFRKVRLLFGAEDYAASAIETICHYAESCNVSADEIKGGLLTNERFQLIEDLRPAIRERLSEVHRVE